MKGDKQDYNCMGKKYEWDVKVPTARTLRHKPDHQYKKTRRLDKVQNNHCIKHYISDPNIYIRDAAITGDHRKLDQTLWVKIVKYIGFCVDHRAY